MTITAADVSVAVNGDIRWEAGGAGDGPYTVLELHRFLQDLADAASSSGDDLIDITSSTPSERSTDNIITLLGTYNIDDIMAEHLYDGSITQASGDEMYSGLVVVGSVFGTTTLQVVQDNTLYDGDTPFWGTGLNPVPAENILSRMLIKTRTAGADIDGRRIRVFAREWGETFAEFGVTMGLGNSVAAIFTVEDLNNQTAVGTVATWTTISNTEGYQEIDLDNGDGAQPYYAKWDYATYGVNDVYERTKWLSMRGTAETLHTMDGELFRGITHEIPYDNELVSEPVEDEVFTWGSGATAGSGAALAIDDNGDTGTIWIQLLTGVPPVEDMQLTGGTSGTTVDADAGITARSLSPHFFGTSTGSAIIGAYGICVDPTDAGLNDKFFDLTNTLRIPPNNQDFIVGGLVNGEDYVLVAWDDTGIDFDQLTLQTTLNGAAETAVVVTAAIPTDTPQTGTIRVQLDDGRYRKVPYTSWTSSTFTIGSSDWTDPNDATAPRNVFISYLDLLATGTSESVTIKYSSDRTFYVRVRDGGGTPIKTFETTGAFTSAGGSTTAIRTSDA